MKFLRLVTNLNKIVTVTIPVFISQLQTVLINNESFLKFVTLNREGGGRGRAERNA